MLNWTIMEWNEQNSNLEEAPIYVQEAYKCKKYAFVSDYVRLMGDNVFINVDESKAKCLPPLCYVARKCRQRHGSCVNPLTPTASITLPVPGWKPHSGVN